MQIKHIKLLTPFLLLSCIGCNHSETAMISENTFVYKDKVYQLVDNELTEVGDLNSKQIRKFQVVKPKKKNLGTAGLNYVKPNASADLDALYRGNILYFKLTLIGLNDLKEEYTPGIFTINFKDEYGFILHSTEVPTSELVGLVDENGQVGSYIYDGKTEMSTAIDSEIKSFSVSSTVKRKSSIW